MFTRHGRSPPIQTMLMNTILVRFDQSALCCLQIVAIAQEEESERSKMHEMDGCCSVSPCLGVWNEANGIVEVGQDASDALQWGWERLLKVVFKDDPMAMGCLVAKGKPKAPETGTLVGLNEPILRHFQTRCIRKDTTGDNPLALLDKPKEDAGKPREFLERNLLFQKVFSQNLKLRHGGTCTLVL